MTRVRYETIMDGPVKGQSLPDKSDFHNIRRWFLRLVSHVNELRRKLRPLLHSQISAHIQSLAFVLDITDTELFLSLGGTIQVNKSRGGSRTAPNTLTSMLCSAAMLLARSAITSGVLEFDGAPNSNILLM